MGVPSDRLRDLSSALPPPPDLLQAIVATAQANRAPHYYPHPTPSPAAYHGSQLPPGGAAVANGNGGLTGHGAVLSVEDEQRQREERERMVRAHAEMQRAEAERRELERLERERLARERLIQLQKQLLQAADGAVEMAQNAATEAATKALVAENEAQAALSAARMALNAVQMREKRERKRPRTDVELGADLGNGRGRGRGGKRGRNNSQGPAPMRLNELMTLLKLDMSERVVPRPPIDAVSDTNWPIICSAAAARLADYDAREAGLEAQATNGHGPDDGKPRKPLRGKPALRTAIEQVLRGQPYGTLSSKARCALLRVLIDASLRSGAVRRELEARSRVVASVESDQMNVRHKARLDGVSKYRNLANRERQRLGLEAVPQYHMPRSPDDEEPLSLFEIAAFSTLAPSIKRGILRLELEAFRDAELVGGRGVQIRDTPEPPDEAISRTLAAAIRSGSVDQLEAAMRTAQASPSFFAPDRAMVARPLVNALQVLTKAKNRQRDAEVLKNHDANIRDLPPLRADIVGRDAKGSLYVVLVD